MKPDPTKPGAPVIEMQGVAASAMDDPDTIVAEEVNWSVAAGDFWVVAGLQGSGKSDFLFMTAGLTAPVRGGYQLLGERMPIFDEARLRERLRLGLVFDRGQPFGHLTLLESVALPLRYHRNLTRAAAERQVWELLKLTGLEAWANSTPGAMPRHWQKRAGLARALMLKPEILLLDNPLAGLDLRHRAWWLSFLGQLSRGHAWMEGRPTTLVATADDLPVWRHRAGQFAVLKERRWTVLGSWEQLSACADEQVQELLAVGTPGG
jgi:ABC-type transporter Mla maintaining outer membrane lipid asymmetry ATPase subunit MlaF